MSYKLYDFVCHDCGKEFEKLVKSIADIACPYCSSTHTERKLSANSIKVTGQGAYTTKMKV